MAKLLNKILVALGFVGKFSLLLLLTCCGDLLKTKKIDPTYDSLWTNVFHNCGSCHDGSGPNAGGPDVTSKDKFYAAYVGKAPGANWLNSNCKDIMIIATGNPDQSLLLASLDKSYHEKLVECQSRYEAHNEAKVTLKDEEVTALVQWIKDGAKKS